MYFLCLYFLQHLGENSISGWEKKSDIQLCFTIVNGFKSDVKCTHQDMQLYIKPYDK